MTATTQQLQAHLREHSDAILESVARDFDATLLDVLRNLPEGLAVECSREHFVEALQDIATWGDITTIVHTPDVIMEHFGAFPDGALGRGFYNLKNKVGLMGHLRPERCGSIVFLERPFMGLATAGVLFMNVDGGCMFKVFIQRDENKALQADQLARFRALQERLA